MKTSMLFAALMALMGSSLASSGINKEAPTMGVTVVAAAGFEGVFQGENATIIINRREHGIYNLHGQDSVSFWDATCKEKDDHLMCHGTGADLSGGSAFFLITRIYITNAGIQEHWGVYGVEDTSKFMSGQSVAKRVVNHRPKSYFCANCEAK